MHSSDAYARPTPPKFFISCVSSDFKALRSRIANSLRKSGWGADLQEELPQDSRGTLQKLDGHIQQCGEVIQLLGPSIGHPLAPHDVQTFLHNESHLDNALKNIGLHDPSTITATQWEGFLTVYRDRPLFLYALAPTKGDDPHIAYIERMKALIETLRPKNIIGLHPSYFSKRFSLVFDGLIPDIAQYTRSVPSYRPAIERRTKRHRFGRGVLFDLRHILNTSKACLVHSRFLLSAYVQLTNSLPPKITSNPDDDLELLDRLAERDDSSLLLGLALACAKECERHALRQAAESFFKWLHGKTHASERLFPGDISRLEGRFAEALNALSSPASWKPVLEVSWRKDKICHEDQSYAEGFVRWGRHRENIFAAFFSDSHLPSLPARVVRTVRGRQDSLAQIPFSRLEIFTAPKNELLSVGWEHEEPARPGDPLPKLVPMQTVIRIPSARPRSYSMDGGALFLDAVAHVGVAPRHRPSDIAERGAFLLTFSDDQEKFGRLLEGAAQVGVLGLWVRRRIAVDEEVGLLNCLGKVTIEEFPEKVHALRCSAEAESVWREAGLLFDFPSFRSFDFGTPSSDEAESRPFRLDPLSLHTQLA